MRVPSSTVGWPSGVPWQPWQSPKLGGKARNFAVLMLPGVHEMHREKIRSIDAPWCEAELASAIDRVNIRRMLFYIEKKIGNIAQSIPYIYAGHAHEFADKVNEFLCGVKDKRGIHAFSVDVPSSLPLQATIRIQPTPNSAFFSIIFSIRPL